MKRFSILIITALGILFGCSENLEQRVISIHPNNTPAVVEYFNSKDSSKSTVKIVRFYFNGEKQEETMYKNGKKHGVSVMWYLNGEKISESNYADDVLHGSFVQWFESGEKEFEAEYKNGVPTGTWKYYNNDGSLQSEQKF